MAAAHPGRRLRPHVKAHKCTTLAAPQRAGPRAFTCATPREAIGMAEAGLGDDLLVANEVLDPRRLSALAALPTRPGSPSPSTARRPSPPPPSPACGECVIDVDVGLPRCGCDPADAGRLADLARSRASRCAA